GGERALRGVLATAPVGREGVRTMAKTDVIMPQMGESIAEGTVVKWLKKVGDAVKRDEPLFEISTDKVDAEIPSPGAGFLAEIKVGEGTTVGVNTVAGATADSRGEAGATEGAPAGPPGAPPPPPAPRPAAATAPPAARPAAPSPAPAGAPAARAATVAPAPASPRPQQGHPSQAPAVAVAHYAAGVPELPSPRGIASK